MKKKVGFIGQGYIGKNYADDFERRGYTAVRYALEEPYKQNGDKIKDCNIVFIAVPTPTTPEGFDDSIVRKAVKMVKKGATAVIKSTVIPGTTESIQEENKDIFVMHAPEFLTEATAAKDASNPDRKIVGIPKDTEEYKQKAKEVIAILPTAPYELVCSSREAELIKYGGNNWFYFKVVFINMLYDLSQKLETDWKVIQGALAADPRIGSTHLDPIHKSGRGAGGGCFIKDFEAFSRIYGEIVGNELGKKALEGVKNKNIELLTDSKKDTNLLRDVYGKKS